MFDLNIDSVEIQNFRKLKSTHIDFNTETTLFVGANNSGKTSAMVALRVFLIEPKKITLRDVTVGNWQAIDQIGVAWVANTDPQVEWDELLPSFDVWLDVPLVEIHKVVHILPTINWAGGALGVRLRYEVADVEQLKAVYLDARAKAQAVEALATEDKPKPVVRPTCLTELLEEEFSRHVILRAYALDPAERVAPNSKGIAQPQTLPEGAIPFEGQPFKSLITVDEISAQRDFADAEPASGDETPRPGKFKRRLSDQVRSYYDRHLDRTIDLSSDDAAALGALQFAEKAFDGRLRSGFKGALRELEGLGYPGVDNPSITFNTQLKGTEGLKHGSAIQYKIASDTGENGAERFLPETFAGLGYQNLISIVFMLMRFRDEWLAGASSAAMDGDDEPVPLHLVLVEEPEAHLHAQVQQVFINKAYTLLRNHAKLSGSSDLSTQLVVSTHSSHIAHEVDFETLRYFHRHQATTLTDSATTTVANLSHIFGKGDETAKFVKRYLKATHCDLFFADAAIFVEGAAERLLVPYFIRHHFQGLWRRYTSLIDIGGAHAHRFENLVRGLGLTVLVISDLDAAEPTEATDKNGKRIVKNLKKQPASGQGQVTTNAVLKKWHPKQKNVDDLLNLPATEHSIRVSDEYDLYVAYQKAVPNPTPSKSDSEAALIIPRTFEDALVYANYETLKDIKGSTTSQKIRKIIDDDLSGPELQEALFKLLDGAEKAAFAIDCLFQIDGSTHLVPPPYIADGLAWLDGKLDETTPETASDPSLANG